MKKVWALLASILLCAGIALAQSQQEQSLGEISKKLRAQRAKPAAGKVYTNDDLGRLGGKPINVVGQAGAAAASSTASAEASSAPAGKQAAGETAAGGETPAAGGENDEQYWRGRFAEARKKIETADKELDLLQREWQLARTQYSQDPNEAMRQQYLGQQAGGRLNELQQKIDQKKQEVDKYKQELANLENELRRAGGNPGWARP